jgi:hypothetical protein
MHTLSTRSLSALAFDRGEEYDPGQPLSECVIADLELSAGAQPIIADISPADRRRRNGANRRTVAGVPDWFSVDDLVPGPFETVHGELVVRLGEERLKPNTVERAACNPVAMVIDETDLHDQ